MLSLRLEGVDTTHGEGKRNHRVRRQTYWGPSTSTEERIEKRTKSVLGGCVRLGKAHVCVLNERFFH